MAKQEDGYGVQLGRWVRERRQQLGYTQEQVWNRMGMESGESNYIAQLENGRRTKLPEFDYINGLSIALRVPISEVLNGAGVLPVYTTDITSADERLKPILDLIRHVDWNDDRLGYITDVLNGLIRRNPESGT